MKFIHSNENTRAIKELFTNKGPIKCAVSFWGGDALNYIVGDVSRCMIVCNLESGATNPFLIKSLLEQGAQIRSNRKLHSKVYISSCRAIVGSANASSNGLSFEDEEVEGWLEASILVEEPEVVSEINEWFESQWKCARSITKRMLKLAEEKWTEKRNNRDNFSNEKGSVLSALKENPEIFKDKRLYFSIYRIQEPSQEAVETFEHVKSQLKIERQLMFWEGWSELPEDSQFISLFYSPEGDFRFECYYYVPKGKTDYIAEFNYKNSKKKKKEMSLSVFEKKH